MVSSGVSPSVMVRIPISDRLGTYACHQKVYEVCGRENRPLWRRCPGYLLALSRSMPVGHEIRPYAPAPISGQETAFDLLAEVSVSKRKDGQDRSRRCDPILEARIADPGRSYAELAVELGVPWLERQGGRLGFELVNVDRCEYEAIEFVRQRKPVRLGAVRFSGRLRVTDPGPFSRAMLEGVGHGKAWGCGLLLCFGS